MAILHMRGFLPALLLGLFAAAVGAPRWAPPPPLAAPAAALPQMTTRFVVDGALHEWSAAACAPVRNRTDIVHRTTGHRWNGPADAGMEWYAAWNDTGLCLAAVVTDNEVINTQGDDMLWAQDCVELFIDGRVGERFLQPPYSAGAYQLFIRPPMPDAPARLVVRTRDGAITGVQVAGVRTRTGYTLEVSIPWEPTFPAFTPHAGAALGISCTLDDYDARDGTNMQPLIMSIGGGNSLFNSPQHLMRWELCEHLPADASLAPAARLEFPAIHAERHAVTIGLETGTLLAARARRVTFTVRDNTGTPLFSRRVTPKALPAPWKSASRAKAAWPVRGLPDGYYRVQATVHDSDGRALGSLQRDMLLARTALDDLYARLATVDLRTLAQTQPFTAAAYLQVGNAVERYKRGRALHNADAMATALREAHARLDLLQHGTVPTAGMLDLLNLIAHPEAQVVVEYPSADSARLCINWGAIPIATASVRQTASPAAARAALLPPTRPQGLHVPGERIDIAGTPATVALHSYQGEDTTLQTWAPEQYLVVANNRNRNLHAIAVAHLAWADVNAVVILPTSPSTVAEQVRAWATARQVPLVSLDDGLQKEYVLIAGDMRSREIASRLQAYYPVITTRVDGPARITAAHGSRLFSVISPSRAGAEQVLALLVAGKPVTADDVDAIRRATLQAMPAKVELQLSEAAKPYCGDVHSHTFYSDGITSPTALTLEAIACHLDYLVITDHNTLDGAQVASRLLRGSGSDYPLTVGEEVTNRDWHMNAYPLSAPLPWKRSPDEVVTLAHRQQAVVQWNHPGYPRSAHFTAHKFGALRGTGIDAWEHVPSLYAPWKAESVLPVVTGSTDTHNGSFPAERTLIFAPSPRGEDLAAAIRARQAVLVAPAEPLFLYGDEAMVLQAWAYLANGTILKARKAEQLRQALRHLDLVKLLRASSPTVVKPTSIRLR